jgi:hypothetical protein
MKHFHGIDISQYRSRISISSKTYLDTVFNNYGWNSITPTLLPMNLSNEFVRALYSAEPLEPTHLSCPDDSCFRYRDAIGELMWPMITAHPERSYPVFKLSQFDTNPATIHYYAVYGIFQYLSGTHDDRLTYTHLEPLTWGSTVKHTHLRSQPNDIIDEHIPKRNLQMLHGYSDAD